MSMACRCCPGDAARHVRPGRQVKCAAGVGGLVGPCAIIRGDFDDADDWPFRELGAVRGVRGGVPGVCAGDADADWGADRLGCRSCNLLCEVLVVRGVRGKSV